MLTPEIIIKAYSLGLFPMAEHRHDTEIFWMEPPERAILPLDERFHISRSLAKLVRQGKFDIRLDTAFKAVIDGCADRDDTWINPQIREVFCTLHQLGHAHSIEAWQDGALQGGLYGLSLGRAFFAESMFSRVSNASKVCVVALVAHLRQHNYQLCDVQFQNKHIAQFGVIEISRETYLHQLQQALA